MVLIEAFGYSFTVLAYMIKSGGMQELLFPANALTILHGQMCGCCRTEEPGDTKHPPGPTAFLLHSSHKRGAVWWLLCESLNSARVTGSICALFPEFQAGPAVQDPQAPTKPRNSQGTPVSCARPWETPHFHLFPSEHKSTSGSWLPRKLHNHTLQLSGPAVPCS